MKKKKRFCRYAKKATVPILALAILLTAALIPIGAGPPGAYAAATSAEVSLEAVSVDKTNGTLVLAAKLDAVPEGGLSAVQFEVEYPQEFTLIKATDTLLIGNGGFTGEVNEDTGEAVKNPYIMAFGNMDKDAGGVSNATGELAYLTFKVKDGNSLNGGEQFTLQNIKAYTLTVDDYNSARTKYVSVNNDATYTYNADDTGITTVAGGKVTVDTTTTEDTPEVKAPTVQQAIYAAGDLASVTMDASSAGSVAIDKGGVEAIAEAEKSMIVVTDASQLTFDTNAVKNIGKAKLVVETKKENTVTINESSYDAVNYSVTAKINDTLIKNFGDGKVTVSLNLPENLQSKDVKCWNYTDTNYTVVEGKVENNKFVFTTNHFSDYIVGTADTLSAFKSAKNLSEGVTVSGTIASWNNVDDYVIKFYDADTESLTDDQIRSNMRNKNYENTLSVEATTTGPAASGKQYATSFNVAGVGSGSYKIAIYKPGKYVVKVVPFTVDSSAVELGELKMWLYGDVNYDGLTNAVDASQILRYLVGKRTFNQDELVAGNVNQDGYTNAVDATQIKRYVVGKTSALDSL